MNQPQSLQHPIVLQSGFWIHLTYTQKPDYKNKTPLEGAKFCNLVLIVFSKN